MSGANSAGYAPLLDDVFGGDSIWLAYREDVCEQVVMVEGRCDLGPDTMVIGARQAASQALRVGSAVKVVSSALAKGGVTLRVAGIYRPLDPTRPYWADGELIGRSAASVRPVEASFTTYEAVVAYGPTTVELTYDLVARPERLRGTDLAALGGRIRQAGYDIQRGPQRLQSQFPTLTERVRRDQDLVRLGVTGGAGLLLILCWFALFLSVQATAQDRRPDLGWLRLHGTARWRTWATGFGQTALPLLAGGLLGGALGFALARWYGGGVTEPAAARSAMIGAALAAAVAVLGALVAAVVAQWRLMRATVVDLHRRVPPRRRGWRSDVLDLAVVLLAGAAVYQLGVDDSPAGLALFAPALAALAEPRAGLGGGAARRGRPPGRCAPAGGHRADRDGPGPPAGRTPDLRPGLRRGGPAGQRGDGVGPGRPGPPVTGPSSSLAPRGCSPSARTARPSCWPPHGPPTPTGGPRWPS